MLSADISKSEEISRWRTIEKTLHRDFSATKTFSKITKEHRHRHTHTQTDCYNPPPTLGLMNVLITKYYGLYYCIIFYLCNKWMFIYISVCLFIYVSVSLSMIVAVLC